MTVKQLKIYNTLTRKKEIFTPINPESIGLYVCGPTVYDFAHIGNARPVVVFDILTRVLRTLYPKVTYVRNITDVDDKINAASTASGESIGTITERTTQAYNNDMEALGAHLPDITPRATQHISEMIEMIQTLIKKGHAYEIEGHVLFSVSSDTHYGQLSRRNRDELIAGARVEIAPYKKDPADFVLWKPSDEATPGWESPWGRGRPGWHIECSAMANKYLGKTFDIHGGGIDLSFPHHENELAQSCCANGTEFLARYWIHNGHLTVDGEKMSKSLGNFLTVRELLKKYPGETLRLFLMMTHYRQPVDLTQNLLQESQRVLDRLYGALRLSSHPYNENLQISNSIDDRVMDALLDDMNIPLAITILHEITGQIFKETNVTERGLLIDKLRATGNILGILQQDPEVWYKTGGIMTTEEGSISVSEIDQLIEMRNTARKMKNFNESDRIRDLLAAKGITLDDSSSGTSWRRS